MLATKQKQEGIWNRRNRPFRSHLPPIPALPFNKSMVNILPHAINIKLCSCIGIFQKDTTGKLECEKWAISSINSSDHESSGPN